MTPHHASFTLERQYRQPPAKVFRAFGDPAVRARWFGAPATWTERAHTLDFRVGGTEHSRGCDADGRAHTFDARFHAIEHERLIVFSYDLLLDDWLMSVSLTSVSFRGDDDGGTALTFTEQGTFFGDDGAGDNAGREHGTGILLDQLGAALSA